MMSADPVTLVHRYFEYVISNEDLDVVGEILTENVVCSIPSGEILNGRSAVKAAVGDAAAAFPHREVTIIEEIYSGDLAAIRYSLRMTHTGEFQGIAPTGREVSVDAVDLFAFREGRISEIRVYFNPIAIMEQLDVAVRFEAKPS